MPGTTGANLGLTWGWSAHEAGWGLDGFNPGFATLDALVNGAVLARQAAPPGSPVEGDRYIPIATATGDWAGQEQNIAVLYDGDWVFYAPRVGWRIYDVNTDSMLRFDGTEWLGEKYVVGCGVLNDGAALTNDQVLMVHRFPRAVMFLDNFAGAFGVEPEAWGSVDATADTVIIVQKAVNATPNTFTNVGTITITAAGVDGVFDSTGAVNFAQGDVIKLVAPSSADATFADFGCTLVGFEK